MVIPSHALEDNVLSNEFAAYEKTLRNLKENVKEGGSEDPKELARARFILSVYGDFVGCKQISATWKYWVFCQDEEYKSELDELVRNRLIQWGRKTLLTILVDYDKMGDNEKVFARELILKIGPNLPKLEELVKNEKIRKIAQSWSRYQLDENAFTVGDFGIIEVNFHKRDREVKIPLGDEFVIVVSDGRRVDLDFGKIGQVKGGFFDGISSQSRENASWRDTSLVGKGFGYTSLLLRDDSVDGGVQIIKGRETDEGKKIYFLYYKGGQAPPASALFLKNLNSATVEVLTLRGVSVVRRSLRGSIKEYSTPELSLIHI